MNRYICIHGHFYQPPRENPWLEAIEVQDSAQPYHDWNERITSECYGPNTASRILGADKKIVQMVNNYASMSFDFGPTLLSWMERHAPADYQNILKSDREAQAQFSGHGAAIAQVYNHMIMPLANARDKHTQVYWGIKDFEYRFQRKSEGMWLAETAVDMETLDILAQQGIRFTILAPHQASHVRKIGDGPWMSVKAMAIDPQMAYLCRLPSGRTINIFFYDGPIAQEVAFTDLLKSGVNLANRMMGVFGHDQAPARLVHIATDGETYGHHHKYGEMALAYCLHYLKTNHLAQVTVYGEYLAQCAPTHEVQILENTSWSCIHGIERWRSDCGCCIGGHRGWSQKWRAALRDAMDWLRDVSIPLYERHMQELADDPWQIRNHYIDVVLDRSVLNVEKFFQENCRKFLSPQDKVKALKLLELQRHAMLMYTSCGWFFDDISGIEAVQVLQYAGRVVQLARQLFEEAKDFEQVFQKMLEMAPSNLPSLRHGGVVYEQFVKPAMADLVRVGAHYAVSAIFDHHPREKKIYCYTVRAWHYDVKKKEGRMLVIGRAHIRSEITWEEEDVDFLVLYGGVNELHSGTRRQMTEEMFQAAQQGLDKAFADNDIPTLDHLMEHYFKAEKYALKYLFREGQRQIFDEIMRSTLEEFEGHLRAIYEHYYPLMQIREELHIPLPKALSTCIEYILNRDLVDLLAQEKTDIQALERIVGAVKRWSFEVDKVKIRLITVGKINDLMHQFEQRSQDTHLLQTIHDILQALAPLLLHLDLWRVQQAYLAFICREDCPLSRDEEGLLKRLGDDLHVRLPEYRRTDV